MPEPGVKSRVKEYRTASGATQAELAEIVDVSRQTIISIERGRYIPSLPLALKLAQHFTCMVEDLFELA